MGVTQRLGVSNQGKVKLNADFEKKHHEKHAGSR